MSSGADLRREQAVHVPPNENAVDCLRRLAEDRREQVNLLLFVGHRTNDHGLHVPGLELVLNLLAGLVG